MRVVALAALRTRGNQCNLFLLMLKRPSRMKQGCFEQCTNAKRSGFHTRSVFLAGSNLNDLGRCSQGYKELPVQFCKSVGLHDPCWDPVHLFWRNRFLNGLMFIRLLRSLVRGFSATKISYKLLASTASNAGSWKRSSLRQKLAWTARSVPSSAAIASAASVLRHTLPLLADRQSITEAWQIFSVICGGTSVTSTPYWLLSDALAQELSV